MYYLNKRAGKHEKEIYISCFGTKTCFTYSGCANQTAAQNHDTVK